MSDHRLKLSIILFSAVLLSCIVASIHLSTLGLGFGSHLYGSAQVLPGQQALFRFVAVTPHNWEPLSKIQVTAILSDHQNYQQTITTSGHPIAQIRFSMPPSIGPRLTLTYDIHTSLGDDSGIVQLTVMTLPTSAIPTSAIPTSAIVKVAVAKTSISKMPQQTHSKIYPFQDVLQDDPIARARLRGAPLSIALYPKGGVMVRGLHNTLYGWIRSAALSPYAHQAIIINPGKHHLTTDRFGIFSLQHNAPLPPQFFRLTTTTKQGRPISIQLPLAFEPKQLQIEGLETFVTDQKRLTFTLHKLPFSGPIFTDLWLDGNLIDGQIITTPKSSHDVTFTLPRNYTGLLQITAYRDLLTPEGHTVGRNLWLKNSNSTRDPITELLTYTGDDVALDSIQKGIKENAHGLNKALYPLALSRLQQTTQGLPLLDNTLPRRTRKLNRYINHLRSKIHLLFAFTVMLGIVMGIAWAIRHTITTRAALKEVLDDGICKGEEIDYIPATKQYMIVRALDLGAVLGGLLMTLYGLWLLITQISWNAF